jgi:hypothetical protein
MVNVASSNPHPDAAETPQAADNSKEGTRDVSNLMLAGIGKIREALQ